MITSVALTISPSSGSATTTWSSRSTATTGSTGSPTYTVSQSGPDTIATPASGSGLSTYSGTTPETIINDAIAALPSSGGSISIGAGTYTFTTTPINLGGGNYAAIGSTNQSNVEIYGQDNSTILAAGTNLNAAILGGLDVNNWNIHDLAINGNMAVQSDSGSSPPYLWGIVLYGSSNDLIEHVYFHDCKTYGAQIGRGNNDNVLYSQFGHNGGNGLLMYGVTNSLIEGNTVNGASDVGLDASGAGSTYANNVTVTGNWVYNVNLGLSPWGLNTGIGIMTGDDGPAENIQITNNYVQGAKVGIDSDASPDTNTNILISGNTIESTRYAALYLVSTSGVTVKNNTFYICSDETVVYESGVTGYSSSGNTTINSCSTATTTTQMS